MQLCWLLVGRKFLSIKFSLSVDCPPKKMTTSITTMAKQIQLCDDSKENDTSSVACGISVGVDSRATLEKGERLHPRVPLAEMKQPLANNAGATNIGTQHEIEKATSLLQGKWGNNTKLGGLVGSTVDTIHHGNERMLGLPVVTPAPTMLLDASTSTIIRRVNHRVKLSSVKTVPIKDRKSSNVDRRQVLATIDLSLPVLANTRILKVTTECKQSFLQNLDSMICDGSARNSKAVHWACEGEAVVIDKSKKDDFIVLLNTYFTSEYSLCLAYVDSMSTLTCTSHSPGHKQNLRQLPFNDN
jgi:hypothetical protein